MADEYAGGPDDMTGGSEKLSIEVGEKREEPIEVKLKYKSDLHTKVLARLMSLRDMGKEAIEEHEDDWQRVDEHMGMKVDLTRRSIKGDGSIKKREKEMPFEKAFVVPVSFAVEKVLVAQVMSIFGSRDPMTQFDGVGPEDVAGAKLVEAMAAYSHRRTNSTLMLHSAIQSGFRYGVAPVHSYYNEDMGWIMKPLLEGPMMPMVSAMFPDLARPVRQWGRQRAYVRWDPVDPFKLRIDPRKSVMHFQRGDFVGHQWMESPLYFKDRKLSDDNGPYFNCEHIEDVISAYEEKHRTFKREPSSDGKDYGDTMSAVCEHLEVRLIPSDWDLGESDRSEIWWFEWVADGCIVRGHRSAYQTGEYNYAIGETLPDAHTVINQGFGEIIDPFQRFMNWLGTSHFENVKRFVNNAGLLMERFIEVEDVYNPGPTGHIRLTQDAEDLIAAGTVRDARVFFPQLQLTDVTGGHLNDINFMFDLVSRLSGANDPAQGIQLPTKRTATEISAMTSAASQRTQGIALTLDAGLMKPLAEQMVSYLQQFTTDEQWYRVEGDLARELERRLGSSDTIQSTEGGIRALIAPYDIYGQYDYVPYSGLDPMNPSRSADALMQTLQVMSGFPQLMDMQAAMMAGEEEVADIKEWVVRIAENLKVKDIRRLFKPIMPPQMPQVMPDEQMMAAQQAGNVAPV